MPHRVLLALVLVTGWFAGCALIDRSSPLEEALETLPGSVERVAFVDREAVNERLGIEDARSYDQNADRLPAPTDLDEHFAPSAERMPFTVLDVSWEVLAWEGDRTGHVWKTDDDLDVDGVVDDLVAAGYHEERDGDVHRLAAAPRDLDPEVRSRLRDLRELVVIPDEHLFVTGDLAPDVVETVDDDVDSLVDTEAFEDLVDDPDDIEVTELTRKVECPPGSPEPTPERSAVFLHRDETTMSALLVYGSDDDAEAVADLVGEVVDVDDDRLRLESEPEDPDRVGPADFPRPCSPYDARDVTSGTRSTR